MTDYTSEVLDFVLALYIGGTVMFVLVLALLFVAVQAMSVKDPENDK